MRVRQKIAAARGTFDDRVCTLCGLIAEIATVYEHRRTESLARRPVFEANYKYLSDCLGRITAVQFSFRRLSG